MSAVRSKLAIRLSVQLGILMVVMIVLLMGVSFWQKHVETLSQETADLERLGAGIVEALEQVYRRLDLGLGTVSDNPELQAALAAGDRSRLAAITLSMMERLREQGVAQFQFHHPPATSVLRVHAPDKFGDDLSSFRHTVVAANTQRRAIIGLEEGVAGLGYRVVHPVFHEGRHVGSVEFGGELDQRFLTELAAALPGIYYVYRAQTGELLTSFGDEPPSIPPDIVQSALAGRTASYFPSGQERVLVLPLEDFQGRTAAYVQVVQPRKTWLELLAEQAAGFGLMALLGSMLIVVLFFAVGRRLRPVQAVSERLFEVARGNLTVDALAVASDDEIGAMASQLNQMVSDLRQELRQVQAAGDELGRQSHAMAAAAKQSQVASEQITEAIQQVADGAVHQSGTATDALMAMQQLQDSVQLIGRGAQEQTVRVEETSQALRRLDGVISEVAQLAEAVQTKTANVLASTRSGGEALRDALRNMARIRAAVEDASSGVARLDEQSERIGEIVGLIREIADQTNMLALNAAIEAARAGEHGRGFAVVADQVRALAERSADSTMEITQLIEQIRQSVAETVTTMGATATEVERGVQLAGSGGAALDELLSLVDWIDGQVDTMAAAAAGAHSEVRGVDQALDAVVRVTGANRDAADAMAGHSQTMLDAVELVASVSEETAAAAEEVSASSEEIHAAATELSHATYTLTNLADDLNQILSRFRLGA